MAKLRATVYPTVGSGILLGSITGIMKNHILSKLPKGYIKYTYIKNSISSVTEQANNEEDNLVKEKPALSLGLNYSYNDAVSYGDTFRWGMSKIPVNAYQHDRIYTKIMMCEQDNIYLSTIDERVKLIYDVGVRLDSESQAYNLMQYMRSYIGVGRPYYVSDADIEVPLPFECLDLIAAAKGFDRSTKQGMQEFHAYLHKWSGGRITYKRNLSSGNFNYFMKYRCNVMCKIPDPPSIEKTTEGKSVIDAIVRYTVEAEFPTFTNFITEYEELDLTLPSVPQGLQPGDRGDSAIYNFTSKMYFTRMNEDKTLAVTFEFISDVNTPVDETPFTDALSDSMSFFIEHQKQFLKDDPEAVSRHVKIIIAKDNDLLAEGTDYEVDWETYCVKLEHPWYNYTYKLGIYVDLVKYNEVIELHNSLTLNQNAAVKRIAEIKEDV
jgi:hypothetical protein